MLSSECALTFLRSPLALGWAGAAAPLKLIPGDDGRSDHLGSSSRGSMDRWFLDRKRWLRSYELSKVRLFASTIRAGRTVFGLGAHAGYYTLIASRLVGESGHVIAFEPAPRNLEYLPRHLSLNHISNVHRPRGSRFGSSRRRAFLCGSRKLPR